MSAPFARSLLRASGLQCVRGDRRVFDGIGFDLSNGCLLQVSGANGSGKTSLLRMACGLLQPAAGIIQWNGRSLGELGEDYGSSVAYIGHLNAVKDELRVGETFRLGARLSGASDPEASVAAALHEFGFGGLEHLPCRFLSQGQKRRLALARLRLSGSQAIWILDEPFAALDPAGVAVVTLVLEEHLARGGLALLTTHQDVPVAAPNLQRIGLQA